MTWKNGEYDQEVKHLLELCAGKDEQIKTYQREIKSLYKLCEELTDKNIRLIKRDVQSEEQNKEMVKILEKIFRGGYLFKTLSPSEGESSLAIHNQIGEALEKAGL